MTIKIVNSGVGSSQEFPIQTLNEASAKYRAFIEQNGFGASEAGSCYIMHAGKIVAHVSYNGKVWEGKKSIPGATPLFNPYEPTTYCACISDEEMARENSLLNSSKN